MRNLLWIVVIAAPLWAQEPQAEAPKQRRPMPEPRNLQILKPGPQLMATMRAFSAGLGVQCNHCHVQGDMASDEKPQKVTARKMLAMSIDINKNFPDGKMHVTCYTCHRGELEPKTMAADQGGPERRPAPAAQQ
jgi:hypothetical protein